MKYLLLLLLTVASLQQQPSPHPINSLVDVTAIQPNFQNSQYFTLNVPQKLIGKQWYAFLIVQAQQQKFWMRYHVYLSSISKTNNKSSSTKVQCEGTHNDLHGCFISSTQINAKQQNLKVQLIFQQHINVKIKVEINGVGEIKLGERLSLNIKNDNFTRILRMDVRQLKQKYKYLLFQFSEAIEVDQLRNTLQYFVSTQLTPPDAYRFKQMSILIWDSKQALVLSSQQLDQVQFLTFLFGITDDNAYILDNRLIVKNEQKMHLQIGQKYNQLIDDHKSYKFQLPAKRSNNTIYQFHLNINQYYQASITNLQINGQLMNQNQTKQFLNQHGLTQIQDQFIFKLGSQIQSGSFTLGLKFGLIFTIQLIEVDLSFVEVQPNTIWIDSVDINATRYLFFVVDTVTNSDSLNFQVQYKSNYDVSLVQIKFKCCTQKTVQKCKQIAYSQNQTLRLIGLTALAPRKIDKNTLFSFLFKNLTITKYQISDKIYRSIIICQMRATTPILLYGLRWHFTNQLTELKQNKLIKGHSQKDEILIYYFNIIDVTNISFARVHFISSTGDILSYGSNKYYDPDINPSQQQLADLIYPFESSVTFTKLKKHQTYYVYVNCAHPDSFQLTLTFGYKINGNENSPISFLTINEQSRTDLIIQPYQIIFIEVILDDTVMMHVQNAKTLKLCQFLTATPPKTHDDMTNNNYCNDIKTINTIYLGNYYNNSKMYVGIQNQNKQPTQVIITTETEIFRCSRLDMGKSHTFMFTASDNDIQTDQCVIYTLTHKEDIDILIDIQNPRLNGIALPHLSIGKEWKSIMTSNTKHIKAEEMNAYCQGQFEECYLEIKFKINQDFKIEQKLISVTASYSSQPIPLKDGLGYYAIMKTQQSKHFKYPLFNFKTIQATIQSDFGQNFILYAKVVTTDQKFSYPTKQEYQNQTKANPVFASRAVGVPPSSISYLPIYSKDFPLKCNKPNTFCYVLLTVVSFSTATTHSQFLIQVTQTVNQLKEGTRLQKYLQKDSIGYFNYYNNKKNISLLIFTGSSDHQAYLIWVSTGNSGSHQNKHQYFGTTEVVVPNANEGWYSIAIQAVQNCYFSIQVISSKKQLVELSLGFANFISLQSNKKKYFMIRNYDMTLIKLITTMQLKSIGQVTIRGMPVTDSQIGDFVKYINDQLQITKKDKLNYAWTGSNHLAVRSNDNKFCTDCFICYQISSNTNIQGYLSIPTKNQYAVHIANSISNDIMLKDEVFVWVLGKYIQNQIFEVILQAGHIQVDLMDNQLLISTHRVLYNRQLTNNSLMLQKINSTYKSNIAIRVTALQNSDYSFSSKSKFNQQQKNKSSYLQVGRPISFYINNQQKECFHGQLTNNQQEQFLMSVKSYYKYPFNQIKQFIIVQGRMDGKIVDIQKQQIKEAFILSFPKNNNNQKQYQLCISFNNTSQNINLEGSLLFMGNLNYFPENQQMHFKKNRNLTFMSAGRGFLQIDQCSSRTSITLSNRLQDIKNVNSRVIQRRIGNNILAFGYNGPIYLHIDTKDYLTLRWRNAHNITHNGMGYDIYESSTFRIQYDKTNQQLSLKINPINVVQQTSIDLPQIVSVEYHVNIAKEEADLYSAMNCKKGNYMFWNHKIINSIDMTKVTVLKLNNIDDLKAKFKANDYVLIIVKAEVNMKWPKNNQTQNYRFYYPYQQLILSQFQDTQHPVDNKTNQQQTSHSESVGMIIFFILAAVIGTVIVMFILWLKNRLSRSNIFQDESILNSQNINQGTQLQTKMEGSSIKTK